MVRCPITVEYGKMTAQSELATRLNHTDAPLPASTAAEAGSEHQPAELLKMLTGLGAG